MASSSARIASAAARSGRRRRSDLPASAARRSAAPPRRAHARTEPTQRLRLSSLATDEKRPADPRSKGLERVSCAESRRARRRHRLSRERARTARSARGARRRSRAAQFADAARPHAARRRLRRVRARRFAISDGQHPPALLRLGRTAADPIRRACRTPGRDDELQRRRAQSRRGLRRAPGHRLVSRSLWDAARGQRRAHRRYVVGELSGGPRRANARARALRREHGSPAASASPGTRRARRTAASREPSKWPGSETRRCAFYRRIRCIASIPARPREPSPRIARGTAPLPDRRQRRHGGRRRHRPPRRTRRSRRAREHLVSRRRRVRRGRQLSPALAPLVRGIERADSIAFDFHKWLHAPYDAGCVLVRDGELHRSTFAWTPSYLMRMPRGPSSGAPWFTDFTMDLRAVSAR